MKNIPVLHVEGKSLAEAYERALLELYDKGIRVRTQYDKQDEDGNFLEPPSIDATMNITVLEPESEPTIHKAFPGGIEDLREYVMELEGVKDHWMKNMDDPDDTRWEYTYHFRLHDHGSWKEKDEIVGHDRVNQFDEVIDKLVEAPFTRRAQMITWMPHMDNHCYDPPCLQSLWYRILKDEDAQYLNCNVRFRSNDAWGASFMNMFGFINMNRELIADEIEKRTGKKVELGRMNWQADSYHIYGKDIEEFQNRMMNRVNSSDFEDRVWSLSDPMIREIYDEATKAVEEKIQKHDEVHS